MQKSELVTLLSEAYRHLYDLVYLGNCRIADLFFPDGMMRRKDKAWQLQRILLDAIEELNAVPNLPVFSREWRRYRLMVMHYVDGTDPKTISEQLNISRRHYYREHDIATEIIAELLLQRLSEPATGTIAPVPSTSHPNTNATPGNQHIIQAAPQTGSTDRSTLLRAEIARSAQVVQRANLKEAFQGVMRILQDQFDAHQICVELELSDLPDVAIDRGLLRHILIGATQYLTKTRTRATLCVRVSADQNWVNLCLSISGTSIPHHVPLEDNQAQLAAIQEITNLCNVQMAVNHTDLTLSLPRVQKYTVLIIDDNVDLAELFQNWLDQQGYCALVAHSAREGIELAQRVLPRVVMLDLMMPDQDGWEVLQTLATQPGTNQIPVIVCSVLRQEDLALSLGASGFLLKPVTKQDLLSMLEELQARYPAPSGPIAPHYPA